MFRLRLRSSHLRRHKGSIFHLLFGCVGVTEEQRGMVHILARWPTISVRDWAMGTGVEPPLHNDWLHNLATAITLVTPCLTAIVVSLRVGARAKRRILGVGKRNHHILSVVKIPLLTLTLLDDLIITAAAVGYTLRETRRGSKICETNSMPARHCHFLLPDSSSCVSRWLCPAQSR